MTRDADSRGLLIAERVGAVAFITVLTAAAAQISVPLPFTPVPFTFTPMVVLLGAMALMLPQGFARLVGPTGGYLMAYPVAAFVAGWLAERGLDRRYVTSVFAMACGLAIIFASGVSWLGLYVQPGRGPSAALAAGLYPFILGDGVKLLLAAAIMPRVWALTGRR